MQFTTWRKHIRGTELGLWKQAETSSDIYRQRYEDGSRGIDSATVYINTAGKRMIVSITMAELEAAGLHWKS